MHLLVTSLEVASLLLLAAELVGKDRAARWERQLTQRLFLTGDLPALFLQTLLLSADRAVAVLLVRFNSWKARRGLANHFVALAVLLAGAGMALSVLFG